jgi:hypothetical protein
MLRKFRIASGEYEIVPAEVLSVNFSDENPNLVNTIRVKVLDKRSTAVDDSSLMSLIARPLNNSNRRIPIVHEVVLLIKAPSAYTSGTKTDTDNYYIDIIGLSSNLNHNSLPTVSKLATKTNTSNNSTNYNETQTGNTKLNTTTQVSTDPNFTENSLVKTLQPYVGDTIIEGRYGNSIRLSSTQPNTSLFSKVPKWIGNTVDPILIIRNTRQGTDTGRINDFITEDFNKDDSIITLTSGQELEFTPNTSTITAANTEKINAWQQDKWGTVPSIIASSGRIAINANSKEASIFGKEGVSLASDNSVTVDSSKNVVLNGSKIKLGNNATEQAVLGNQLVTLVSSLITTIDTLNTSLTTYAATQATVAASAVVYAPLSPAYTALGSILPTVSSNLTSIRGQLNSILSTDVLVSKKLTVTSAPKPSPFFKNTPTTDFTLTPERREQLTQERETIIQKQNTENRLSVPDQERKRLIERILLYQTELNSEIPKPTN